MCIRGVAAREALRKCDDPQLLLAAMCHTDQSVEVACVLGDKSLRYCDGIA